MSDRVAYYNLLDKDKYDDPYSGTDNLEEFIHKQRNLFRKATDHTMTPVQNAVFESAMKYRWAQRNDKKFEGRIFDKVNGFYEVMSVEGDQYFIEISYEPYHVLSRTTGRPCYSCEEIKNDAWLGPFHDVALMNSTAYFYDRNENWIGRLNLRWCYNDATQGVEIGIDPNIYCPAYGQFQGRDDNFLKEALYVILNKKGQLNYDTATTPYLYKGHSDTTSQYPDVALPYIGYQRLMKKLKPVDEDYWSNRFVDDYPWDDRGILWGGDYPEEDYSGFFMD